MCTYIEQLLLLTVEKWHIAASTLYNAAYAICSVL